MASHPSIRRPPRPARLLALAVTAALAAPAPSIAGTMVAPYPYRPKEFAFVYEGGLFHLFYIRHNILAPHLDSTEVDFGHAVSQDLTNWTQLEPVLRARPGKWDDLHVWSPTIIRKNGVYYMYYTGVTIPPGQSHLYQRTGVATSTDLMSWERYDEPVFDANRVPWAFADSSQYPGCQFRDPFVMPDPDVSGRWLMYYVATPRDAPSQLIVGVGFNDSGMSPWRDLMPLWNTDAAHYQGFIESPCVFDHGGRWYLFFTTNSGHPIRYQHAASPTADSTGWVGTYRLYDNEPGTDAWFTPEFLRVGQHEFFAAVNSANRGIEIREMVWSGVTSFRLETPSLVGVAGTGGGEDGVGIVALAGGERAAMLKFRVTLPRTVDATIVVHDAAGRRIRVLHARAPLESDAVVSWDKRDGGGREVGAGVYFVRLATPAGSRAAAATVLR